MAIRIIANGIHFYTSKAAIRRGVGDHINLNTAVQEALASLENMRKTDKIPPVGLSGTWNGFNVQIDL